ncbi:hypothetical protein V8B97DRAFT_1954228 [Scleroderma yunnanense]
MTKYGGILYVVFFLCIDGGGNGDQPVWNCEGIGLGGVCSQAGVLGVWSTVFHDAEDPVGPFWMRREKFIVD